MKSDGQAIQPIPRASRKRITKFFEGLTPYKVSQYKRDWSTIAPKTDQETINRWRFAYCTIHTPWERSCDQYNQIKGIYGYTTRQRLEHKLSCSSGGMWSLKANGIYHFQMKWLTDRKLFQPTNDWQQWRNKLIERLPNIGQAKISFAIEMIHPHTAQCLCLDRHMLKTFGWTMLDHQPELPQYQHYENYWLKQSHHYNVPPVISRNIFWDKIQNQTNSLYWAHVL